MKSSLSYLIFILAVIKLTILFEFIPINNFDSSPKGVVMEWTRLYGKNTVQAAFLTTEQFRKGMSQKEWGEQIQGALSKIHYEHLGGKIIKEEITGLTAIVVLKATIAAVDGISTQTEIYSLKLKQAGGSDWLIDGLAITEEVVPANKWPHEM